MAKVIKRGKSLRKQEKKIIRKDNMYTLSNIGFLILSVVLAFQLKTIIPFALWIIYRVAINKGWKATDREIQIIRAGIIGEVKSEEALLMLPDDYHLFSDSTIAFQGKESQIDHIVIGPTGIFAIEAKYWSGRITEGTTEDRVYQENNYGIAEHYNPIKQVGTHVYRLSSMLKENGIKEWVNGCVYFSNTEADVRIQSEKNPVFSGAGEVLNYIKKQEREEFLTKERIKEISEIIRKNLKK